MQIQILPGMFNVCKISDIHMADLSQEYIFLAKTDEEISLVCQSEHAPQETLEAEHGWRAMRVTGVLDFSLTGILARISELLAIAGVSIFAVSTYNTDYILVKQEQLDEAVSALENGEYTIIK